MKAIIVKSLLYGTLDGVFMRNTEIMSLINGHLQRGTAKLLVDTEDTLMYELADLPNEAPRTIQAYVEFSGGSIYGFGHVRKTTGADANTHKYVFTCPNGNIYFDSVNDRQMSGLTAISNITDEMLPQ